MPNLFKTRITELYGIKLPVIASGLQWLADPEYVGAAVNAGLMGFMTAASFKDVAALRAGIRRCREITGGKPFGVNIMIRVSRDGTDRVTPLIDAVIDEGVRFVETAGNNPEAYLKRFKDAGIKVLHKVPGVRYAKKAESLGVDAVTVVGAEAGGHPGVEPVGTMVAAAAAARAIKIPLIVAGGLGTGEQLVAALALGADGIGDRHAFSGGRGSVGAPPLQGAPGRRLRNRNNAAVAIDAEYATRAENRACGDDPETRKRADGQH